MRSLFALLLSLCALSAAAQVTSLYPASGPAQGGTFVHIVGKNLLSPQTGAPAAPLPQVRFGDVPATLVSYSNTELIAVAPAHAEGTVNVTVTEGGTVSAGGFVYQTRGEDLERVLLPVVVGGPGAFGSVWVANVTAYATSGAATLGLRDCPSPATCRPSIELAPKTITALNVTPDPGSVAAFVYIPHDLSNTVDFSLRVQDTSRQSQTWGTEIPPVFATDFADTVWLHDVPVGDAFRSALRIYGYTGQAQFVAVNMYDDSGKLVLSRSSATNASVSAGADQPYSPSTLIFTSLVDSFPELRGREKVQVEVTAISTGLADPSLPPLPLWAFASVTNNETQHVTTVTPHRAR